jgi:phenylacetate-CoA ligase
VLTDENCPCGRGLPVLHDVQGRSTDFVVAADGTVMHGLALIYAVRDLPGVARFRIEQLSLAETLVQLEAGPAFDEAARTRVERDFKSRLGADVHIRIEVVDHIAAEASGKFRYVVSHVHAPPLAIPAAPEQVSLDA